MYRPRHNICQLDFDFPTSDEEDIAEVDHRLGGSDWCRDTEGVTHALDPGRRPICGRLVPLKPDLADSYAERKIECLECHERQWHLG